MSKPVAYSVLIRNGQKRRFEEVWVTLYRELLWGPDAFSAWLEAGEEAEYEPEELSGVAVVDFDSQTLQWGEHEVESVPAVQIAQRKLLQQAWPGFEITYLSHGQMYKVVRNVARLEGPAAANSEDDADENDEPVPVISIPGLNDDDFEDDAPTGKNPASDPEDDNQDDDPLGYRPQTVREAAGQSDNDKVNEDDEDGEDDEQDDVDDSDFPGAWITIIDQNGKVRQRRMRQISNDLLTGVRTSVQELAQLKAAEVPPEKSVTEGFWINVKDKQIGIWGGHTTLECLHTLQKSWPKWKVDWAVNGYRDQCAVSGVPGMRMPDTEVLAKFIPQVLSAKKMDLGEMFGAVGSSLRKKAMKATGCLVVVINVSLYAQHLPRFMAVVLVRWRRFRRWLGCPVTPLSASRWYDLTAWDSHADMPSQALSRWAPIIEQLENLGFEICGRIRSDTIGSKTEATIFLRDASGQTIASIIWMQIGSIEQTLLAMTSYLHEGIEIATLALPPDQQLMLNSIAAPYMQAVALSHHTLPRKLFQAHTERPEVAKAIVFTADTFLPYYRDRRKEFFDYSLGKGTLRQLRPNEVRRLASRKT